MIDEIIRDNYRVLDQIGEDRLATVYLARDQAWDEMVVLKVIRPEVTAGGEFRARFRLAGHTLGAYRLIEKLGRGGMEDWLQSKPNRPRTKGAHRGNVLVSRR